MTKAFVLIFFAFACKCTAEEDFQAEEFALLQAKSTLISQTTSTYTDRSSSPITLHSNRMGQKDLVLMHMPYNFGNTVEKVAMFSNASKEAYSKYVVELGGGSFAGTSAGSKQATWDQVNKLAQAGGEVWGHMNPDLQVTSAATGCPLYLSPPKHWPQDVAKTYFGNRTIFGIIRDPYEKLVAQFRGGMPDYGGYNRLVTASCDINTAVKSRMKAIIATGKPPSEFFEGGCASLPQSEFFEGDYGITLPVDNWKFPKSMNEVFETHGYDWRIETDDILHVNLCNEHWSGDFDSETRSLVQQVYKKDFELLCKSFGYCDYDQNTCLQGVPNMCPPSLLAWDESKKLSCPIATASTVNLRMRTECSSAAD